MLALVAACGGQNYTAATVETQGVDTPPGPLNVTITNFNGPITVTPGADGRVEAVMERRSKTADTAAAQAEVDAIALAISQQGPDVTLVVDYTGPSGGAEAALDVTVPAGSTLALTTATGAIDARGSFGDVTAEVGSGGITFGALEDESFTLAIAGTGELQSDFETLSSRPLTGSYEGQVGDAPTRRLSAVLGSGKVFLRQIAP